MPDSGFALSFQAGLAAMNLSHSPQQIEQLQVYVELLQKWNRIYNLTSIKSVQKMVAYHILDSLGLVNMLPQYGLCLDVGTGAGLPGIPLAIMLPASEWVLLDSNGKKTRFVQQAIACCGLSNVKVVNSRIEDYHADSTFDVIVSRAYASLIDFVTSVDHLWQADTRLISMKTEISETELQALDAHFHLPQITRIQIPGIAEKRSLITLQRQET